MSLVLITSIVIRLAAMVWSVHLWRRISDWRLGFLTVMLALMASRQTMTLLKTSDSWAISVGGQLTELPGLVVSVMAFLAVLFLGNIILEQRRAELEKKELIEQLQRKNLELERFLYSASHDLKSPLVTISGFLGVLQQDALASNEERVKRDVALISGAVQQMGRSLSELVEVSRLGTVASSPEAVSLAEVVDRCLASIEDRISACGVDVQIADGLPVVTGEEARLFELIRNLLENAIKFCCEQDEPRIEIGVRLEAEEVVCFVADNGIGIAEEYREKIFGLFERLDTRIEGSGLGLAIVRRIAELHGGRAWAESDGPGQGSTICFSFPSERVVGYS